MSPTPKYSIILPVFNTNHQHLRACLESIVRQSFNDWEVCVVDDCSTDQQCRDIVREFAVRDSRVKILFRNTNGGISAASNDGLAIALGQFLVLVDHDDFLELDALQIIDEYVCADPDVDYLYTDEFHYLSSGECLDFRKPDWSPERFRSQMYTCHLSVLNRELVELVGRFRSEFDGSQDYDLVLRVTEQAQKIIHIAQPLYYWRANEDSFSRDSQTKNKAFEAGRRAVEDHCHRIGLNATVQNTKFDGIYRVQRRLSSQPVVSVIIPTAGTGGFVFGAYRDYVVSCIASFAAKSTYRKIEYVVVADTSTPRRVIDQLAELDIENLKIIWYDRTFNFSDKINVGASYASGSYLFLLNDDTEIITEDWCEQLLTICEDPTVGSVGCTLLFENQALQHLGHCYVNGSPTHIGIGELQDSAGPFGNYGVQREVSGVTAAALMVKRSVFADIGGMSTYFPGNYNDVDFAQRLLLQGLRNIITPHVTMYHFESASRDPSILDEEILLLQNRWWRELENDRYTAPKELHDDQRKRRRPNPKKLKT